jgi:hypothetical protein
MLDICGLLISLSKLSLSLSKVNFILELYHVSGKYGLYIRGISQVGISTVSQMGEEQVQNPKQVKMFCMVKSGK